jgi:hypothetical protein
MPEVSAQGNSQSGRTWCSLSSVTGLGLLIAGSRGATGRVAGWLLAAGLAAGAVVGNAAVLRATHDGVPALGRRCTGADLVMIAPADAQGAVYAMLLGDSPAGSETVRWPPVCADGVEGWCRCVGGLHTVSVYAVRDDIVSAAAMSPRSIWIFRAQGAPADHDIPPRLRRCDQILRNSVWTVLGCSSATLRTD